jgi:hypothetical protein
MQRYTIYLYPETAVHVSGGTTTHHQERIQLSTASGITHTVMDRVKLLIRCVYEDVTHGVVKSICTCHLKLVKIIC